MGDRRTIPGSCNSYVYLFFPCTKTSISINPNFIYKLSILKQNVIPFSSENAIKKIGTVKEENKRK